MKDKVKKQVKLLDIFKNKYALVVLGLGLLLVLWPSSNKTKETGVSELTAPSCFFFVE